jgi:hypothetical protein
VATGFVSAARVQGNGPTYLPEFEITQKAERHLDGVVSVERKVPAAYAGVRLTPNKGSAHAHVRHGLPGNDSAAQHLDQVLDARRVPDRAVQLPQPSARRVARVARDVPCRQRG